MVLNKREFLNLTKKKFYDEIKNYQSSLKPTKEIEGYAASSIVGEKGYPNVPIHSISNENLEGNYFKTAQIVKKDYNDIIKLKARNILGSTESINKRKIDSRMNDEINNIYKSKSEVNFSSNFDKELKFDKVVINKFTGILGNKNELVSIKTNQNTKTSKQIEKYTTNDIKAKDAIISLYERDINEHQITNLLALGNFGISVNKTLVPTRWAITAYDQTIEKHLFSKIKEFKIDNYYRVFYYNDKGNEFVIVSLPTNISGTIIEKFSNVTEIDNFDDYNKLDKKEPMTAGGYYATKVSMFEHLVKQRIQAAFISSRIIEDYDIPLGVVFVRETVRSATVEEKYKFSTLEEMKEMLNTKYPKHNKNIIESKTFKKFLSQKTLNQFF